MKFSDTSDQAKAFVGSKRLVPPVQYKTGKKFDTLAGTEYPVESIDITDSDDSAFETARSEHENEDVGEPNARNQSTDTDGLDTSTRVDVEVSTSNV